MAKNITLLGASYSDVPAVTLPQTGGGTARFDDCSVVTATASDVAQGKVFVASDGTVTTGTASGGGGTDFIVTLSYDSQSDMWTPDCTYAELYSAYSGGKSIAWVCDDNSVAYGYFAVNEFDYDVYEYFEDSDGEGFVVHTHAFSSSGVTDYGRTDKYYSTYDATALPTDVANGKIFYNANGRQTGTASGGGGASNFFTGTFKGSTAGEILNVDIPYTGSGYPLCAVIVPTGGLIGNSTFYNTLKRYAIGMLSIYKTYTSTVPTYASSGTQNQCTVQAIYKNSSSTATSFTRTSVNDQVILYGTSADPSGVSQSVLFANATRMRVRIQSNSYGFMKDIEYTYYVIYSQ